MKSTFSSGSRPSILLEEPRGGHMHGRLSPPSFDFKPPRGMDGQSMFTVRICLVLLSIMSRLSVPISDITFISPWSDVPIRP
jgi:hypothetical protein